MVYAFSVPLRAFHFVSRTMGYPYPYVHCALCFMPNAKVKITKTIGPAMIASIAMLCLQAVYIHGQIFLTAIMPFMGRLQHFRCLCCGYLRRGISVYSVQNSCYFNQNLEYYECLIDTEEYMS